MVLMPAQLRPSCFEAPKRFWDDVLLAARAPESEVHSILRDQFPKAGGACQVQATNSCAPIPVDVYYTRAREAKGVETALMNQWVSVQTSFRKN